MKAPNGMLVVDFGRRDGDAGERGGPVEKADVGELRGGGWSGGIVEVGGRALEC